MKKQAKLEASRVNQYYRIGAVIVLGVIGGLGYYIYRTKKVEQPQKIILNHTHNHRPTSLRWIKSFLHYKMDKKSIVNDLYQAAVISVLAVGYLMLGKKILKMTPPKRSKVWPGRRGKIGWHCSHIRDDQRVSHETEDLTRSYKCIKMASIVMLIRGALVNALAFTGSSYLFHRKKETRCSNRGLTESSNRMDA